MARIITNKFEKVCSKGCSLGKVKVGEGFAVGIDGVWSTYHKECLPECFVPPSETPHSENFINEQGEIFFAFNRQIIELVKTIPGRRFDPVKKCWSIPLTPEAAAKAVEVCGMVSIKVDEKIKQLAAQHSVYTFVESNIPEIQNTDKLFDYQVEGANFLASNSRALLGDQMGTGKTIQALSAIPKNGRVLVVAPACVKYNWAKEANKWRPDFSVKVINGKNNFEYPGINEIVVCNREILPDDLLTHKLPNGGYSKLDDALVAEIKSIILLVDEAHQFKGTKTASHKKLRSLSRFASKVWAMTGTPLLNRPIDLWGVLAACNLENKIFGTSDCKPFDHFKECFHAHQSRFGLEWGMPDASVPMLMKKAYLARKREDVLPQLPRKIYTDLLVPINPTGMGSKIIKQLDDLGNKFDENLKKGSLPPFQAFEQIRAQLAASRVEPMMEYIQDCEEQEIPLVVFSAHVPPLDLLRNRPGWAVVDGSTKTEDRQKIVEMFQNGELHGIACTIKAMGVGQTLTRAWKVLFIDLDWVPAHNQQAEDRCCRIGQTSDKVEIVRFVSNHPLDNHIMMLLDKKADLIRQTLEG